MIHSTDMTWPMNTYYRFFSWRCYLSNHVEPSDKQQSGFCMERKVWCTTHVSEQALDFFRVMAFMVLGLLIIANIIARPNYPPKASSTVHKQQTSIKSLFSDIPYMIAILGFAPAVFPPPEFDNGQSHI